MHDETVIESTQNRKEIGDSPTSSRLERAALTLLQEHVQDEVSVRSIAHASGSAISAIDYHFGSLEQLFVSAHRLALTEAKSWTEEQLAKFSDLGTHRFGDAAMAGLIAALIESWTGERRALALAWREAQHRTGEIYTNLNREWNSLWRQFWDELCRICGRPEDAGLIRHFFDGTSYYHLLRWRPLLDRALLQEDTLTWCCWLSGSRLPEPDIRLSCLAAIEAEYDRHTSDSGQASTLDKAAAALLEERGSGALTFRALAAYAGVTLGTVNYHFGSKARLRAVAFRTLYHSSLQRSFQQLLSPSPAPEEMKETMAKSVAGRREPITRALDEILLYLCRLQAPDSLNGPLRYSRGQATGKVIPLLLGTTEPAPRGLAAAFSAFSIGLDHSCIGLPTEEAVQHARAMINDFCERYRKVPGDTFSSS